MTSDQGEMPAGSVDATVGSTDPSTNGLEQQVGGQLILQVASEAGQKGIYTLPPDMVGKDPSLYQMFMYALGTQVTVRGSQYALELTREQREFGALLLNELKTPEGGRRQWEFLLKDQDGTHTVHGDDVHLHDGTKTRGGQVIHAIVVGGRTLGYL